MQPPLLPIAVLAIIAWAAAFGAIMLARRSRISQQAASGSSWAEQPPAIVALLCSERGDVPECAVTATFLDLIARGLLQREVDASGHVRIGPAGGDLSAMKPYERQVLDHVAARASLGGGTVLEEVPRLESSEHATRWMKDFSETVIADAQSLGLVEDRASLRLCFFLWFGLAAAPALLATAAIGFFFAVFGFIVLAPMVTMLRRQRPTEAGSQLISMYRALAARQENGAANASGPVDRKRAYAAALGAGGPEHSPLAHRDADLVWSNMSGQWREVRIIDGPGLFHGTDPVTALYTIPGALAFFGAWTALLYGFTAHPERGSIPAIVLAVGWLVYAFGNFFVWRFVYRGLYDLRARTFGVEGQVIYLDVRDEDPGKTYHVAIDDGRSGKAIRHQIGRDLFAQLRYGDRLRLEVTPTLGCIRSTRIVPAPSV